MVISKALLFYKLVNMKLGSIKSSMDYVYGNNELVQF
jgi:hypothetical protein